MKKMFNKIYVEITNHCNLSCSFCSSNILPKREMTVDEFKIIIDKIIHYTDTIYLHVKGEPLLHSRLDEILTICDNYKIKVNITTNGTLLSKKKDILLKHDIHQINVSLHCENNFSNYFENVFKTCDELRIKTTIIYRIWTLKKLHLDKISTTIVHKIISHYNLSPEIVDKIMDEKNIKIANNIYIDKENEFVWPEVNNFKEDYGTCLGCRSHIAVLSNGNVVPCCLDSNSIITLGNLYQQELMDIVNSKLFKEIREGFQNHQIKYDLCKSCTYRKRFH